ncbi:CPBP family intramembrane metalloprotease [bacterium]|nr:MAG: CPBP family intramembrane metalloprotease [bacterium]
MAPVLVLSLLAPLSIYFGLIVLQNVPLTFILYHGIICLGIPLIDFTMIQKQTVGQYLNALGFRNFRKTLFPSLITGLLFGSIIYLFITGLQKHLIDIEQTRSLLARWNFSNNHLFLFLFIMIFANSVLEEIYWRGCIYSKLEGSVSPKVQILFTAFFYASYHLITTTNLFSVGYGLLLTSAIFGAGCFWGYFRQKQNSIYLPIISHLLADLGIMLVYIKFFI